MFPCLHARPLYMCVKVHRCYYVINMFMWLSLLVVGAMYKGFKCNTHEKLLNICKRSNALSCMHLYKCYTDFKCNG